MTSQALNRPVDVLAVFDDLLAFASRGVERDDPAREMIEAAYEVRAAVVDLIAAGKRAERHLTRISGSSGWRDGEPQVLEQMRTALAAIGSQP